MSKGKIVFKGVVFTNLVTPEFLATSRIPPQEVFKAAAELYEQSRPVWENGADFLERNSQNIRRALALLHGKNPDEIRRE